MGLLCLMTSAGTTLATEAEADDDDDGDDGAAKPAVPNIYLDLRTTYATIPAGTLGLGFGNNSLSAKSIAVDLPLTVNVKMVDVEHQDRDGAVVALEAAPFRIENA
jgi:hypothetical protein